MRQFYSTLTQQIIQMYSLQLCWSVITVDQILLNRRSFGPCIKTYLYVANTKVNRYRRNLHWFGIVLAVGWIMSSLFPKVLGNWIMCAMITPCACVPTCTVQSWTYTRQYRHLQIPAMTTVNNVQFCFWFLILSARPILVKRPGMCISRLRDNWFHFWPSNRTSEIQENNIQIRAI